MASNTFVSIQGNGADTTNFVILMLDLLAVVFLGVGLAAFFLARSRQIHPHKVVSTRSRIDTTHQSYTHNMHLIVLTTVVILLLLVWLGASIMPAVGSIGRQTNLLVPSAPARPRITPTRSSSQLSLVTPGFLTVGSDTSFPPEIYLDPQNHQSAGFDVDLMNALAQQMHLQVRIVPTMFNDLINALHTSKLDVVISAYALTPDVLRSVQAVPYLQPADVLLVRKGNPMLGFTMLTDLCGHIIGVQGGTTEDTKLKNANSLCAQDPIVLSELSDADAVGEALVQGRVDATFQDSPASSYYLKKYPGRIQLDGPRLPASQEGILVRSTDTALFNAIQMAYKQIGQNGTYSKLLKVWQLTNDGIPVRAQPTLEVHRRNPS